MWSGTDYNKNVNEFTKQSNLESSTEWSYNGNRSLKLTRIGETFNEYTTEYYPSEPFPQGDYLFSCKVYSPTANGNIALFRKDQDAVNVGYTISNNVQTVQLSIENSIIIGFRVLVYKSLQSVYLDEISLISQ